jgi:hypothetical protein
MTEKSRLVSEYQEAIREHDKAERAFMLDPGETTRAAVNVAARALTEAREAWMKDKEGGA